jgi:hypothetical protein
MEVCYPGKDVPQKTTCLNLNHFNGVGYTINLIVFESKGIDVILGRNWLS